MLKREAVCFSKIHTSNIYEPARRNIPEDCTLKASLSKELFMQIWHQLAKWIVTAVSE
jgi:hypothetical protein